MHIRRQVVVWHYKPVWPEWYLLEIYCRMVSIKNTKHQCVMYNNNFVAMNVYWFYNMDLFACLTISNWILLVGKYNDLNWDSTSFVQMKIIKDHLGQILHLVLFYVQRNILSLIHWYFNDIPVLGNTPKYKRKGVYAMRKTISDIVELYFLPSTPFFVRSIH